MPALSTIKTFIVNEFLPDVTEAELPDDFDLIEQGVIDSLGLLKVIAWLENTYQVSIDAMDMVPENFSSVRAIGDYLVRTSATQPA